MGCVTAHLQEVVLKEQKFIILLNLYTVFLFKKKILDWDRSKNIQIENNARQRNLLGHYQE